MVIAKGAVPVTETLPKRDVAPDTVIAPPIVDAPESDAELAVIAPGIVRLDVMVMLPDLSSSNRSCKVLFES